MYSTLARRLIREHRVTEKCRERDLVARNQLNASTATWAGSRRYSTVNRISPDDKRNFVDCLRQVDVPAAAAFRVPSAICGATHYLRAFRFQIMEMASESCARCNRFKLRHRCCSIEICMGIYEASRCSRVLQRNAIVLEHFTVR